VTRWDATGDAPRGHAYDARWERLAASGQAIHGEADLVASLGPATVLDAGCGTGRVAMELARRGVVTVGVDLDPSMVGRAREKAPELAWVLDDLATVDVAPPDGRAGFDVVVAAGNVLVFLAPGTEAAVVANLARHLRPGGHLVAGFQVDPRLPLATYDDLCATAGLTLAERWSTWERDAYDGGAYAVSVHRR
jgi:SAM-dependent methyltransferase